MANATSEVKKATVRRTDEFIKRGVETLASQTTFYVSAMMGIDESGYLSKFDDTEAMLFAGVVRGCEGNPVLAAATAGDAGHELDIHQPFRFQLDISGVAVTDYGKPVYATFDNAGTLDQLATTYANLIGHVVAYLASGIALVEPAYDGVAAHARYGASKRVAATGTTTLSKFYVNKNIFCANSAAKSVVLPAIASCPPGSRLTFVKDHASDTNALTLDGADSEEIDAATTLATMDAPYDVVTVVSNGVRWIVTARDLA